MRRDEGDRGRMIIARSLTGKYDAGDMMLMKRKAIRPEHIDGLIYTVRGQKVMLDSDLAKVYGVETKALNRAVKRNRGRFPEDFVMQLTPEDLAGLRCRIGTSNAGLLNGSLIGRGGRRYLPYVFTDHGAFMAASVLNSKRAVRMSVFVVRAFVRLRNTLSIHKELAGKLAELERRLSTHDGQIQTIISAIRQLMSPPQVHTGRRFGFRPDDEPPRKKG